MAARHNLKQEQEAARHSTDDNWTEEEANNDHVERLSEEARGTVDRQLKGQREYVDGPSAVQVTESRNKKTADGRSNHSGSRNKNHSSFGRFRADELQLGVPVVEVGVVFREVIRNNVWAKCRVFLSAKLFRTTVCLNTINVTHVSRWLQFHVGQPMDDEASRDHTRDHDDRREQLVPAEAASSVQLNIDLWCRLLSSAAAHSLWCLS